MEKGPAIEESKSSCACGLRRKSLKGSRIDEPPKKKPSRDSPETVLVAKAAFPSGSVYMQMRDELGSIYRDELFASAYAQEGQLAIAPWRLALVSEMQFAENLSDQQEAFAVRARIDWKYALSLPSMRVDFIIRSSRNFGTVCCKEVWKADCWTPSLSSVSNEAISAPVDGNEPIPRMC